jgi:Flp pilus assembly protein TadG
VKGKTDGGNEMSKRAFKHQQQRGQGLVELALTMPLLVMIFSGLAHFGMIMQNQHVITNASRVGARAATQPGGTLAGVQTAVAEYCQQAGLDPSQATVQADVNTASTWATVTVSYPFTSPLQGILAAVGLGRSANTQDPLRSTTVMRL